jgi:hypothetical protein
MAVIIHHSRRHGEDDSRPAAIFKAILTVIFVTAIVAAALGGATYVVSHALVSVLSSLKS